MGWTIITCTSTGLTWTVVIPISDINKTTNMKSIQSGNGYLSMASVCAKEVTG